MGFLIFCIIVFIILAIAGFVYQTEHPEEAEKIREQQEHEHKRKQNPLQIHCPTCGSTDVEKISGASKVGKAAAFGVLAAGSISKTFHCKNCGYKW